MKYYKLIISSLIVIFIYNNIFAQRYAFEELSDTSFRFQPLDSSVIQEFATDTVTIPLGFNFNFYNKTFDSVNVTPNGHFVFISKENDSVFDYGKVVMGDYILDDGTIFYNDTLFYKYKTSGEIGNRIFTYECIDMSFSLELVMCFTSQNNYEYTFYIFYKDIDYESWGYGAYTYGNAVGCDTVFFNDMFNINFQIKLYEENGNIEIQYGNRTYPLDLDVVFKVSDEKEDITCLTGTSSTIIYRHDRHYENEDYYFSLDFLHHFNIFRFYFDNTDKILVNDKDILSQNLKGGKYTYGAFPGSNIWLDNEWAEKFYISKPVLLKGIVSQNFGWIASEESAIYSIYSVGDNDLPNKLLYQKEIAYNCLDLDGNLNYILFDSVIEIEEPFFVSFV